MSKQLAESTPSCQTNAFPSTSSTFDISGAPLAQRRRVGPASLADRGRFQPEWNDMYTFSPPSGKFSLLVNSRNHSHLSYADSDDNTGSSDVAEGVGQLSLDENSEVKMESIIVRQMS